MLVYALRLLNAWLRSSLVFLSTCEFGRICSSVRRSTFYVSTKSFDPSDWLRSSLKRSPGAAMLSVYIRLSILVASFFRNQSLHVDTSTGVLIGLSSTRSAFRRCPPILQGIGRYYGINSQSRQRLRVYGSCTIKISLQLAPC